MGGYIFLVKIDNIGLLKLKFPLASSLLQKKPFSDVT